MVRLSIYKLVCSWIHTEVNINVLPIVVNIEKCVWLYSVSSLSLYYEALLLSISRRMRRVSSTAIEWSVKCRYQSKVQSKAIDRKSIWFIWIQPNSISDPGCVPGGYRRWRVQWTRIESYLVCWACLIARLWNFQQVSWLQYFTASWRGIIGTANNFCKETLERARMQIDPSRQSAPDNYKLLANLVVPRPW